MQILQTIDGIPFIVDAAVAVRFSKSRFELFAGYVCFCGGGAVWRNSLHRLLCQGAYVDHINGNKLDNRVENLRACTQAHNLLNSVKRKGSSKYKGVSWSNSRKKWCVYVRDLDGLKHNLGRFSSEEEAHAVYEQAAKLYHGEFYRRDGK